VTGRIERRRGQLDLIGRIFELRQGRIAFDGRQPIDPSVAIRFERTSGDFTGRIEVGGTASSPTLGFSSTPAVSEDEVLPRVLFGRSFQSLSGPEALQLAAGIATLTSGGPGIIDRTRGSLGLDVLRIETDDEGSSSVAVGRYVREGVYVGAKESLDGTTGSVVVEVELPRSIVVDADVDHAGEMSLGVGWRRDF
jgi:translocation and assembly module TamB